MFCPALSLVIIISNKFFFYIVLDFNSYCGEKNLYATAISQSTYHKTYNNIFI